jgi:1,4-alpha-glucan branching enzyme
VQSLSAELNRLHVALPALHRYDHEPRGFDWLDFSDADQSIIAFVRHGDVPADDIVCAFNFTPVPRYGYCIPVPAPGVYREILNTDASEFGGGGIGNAGYAHGIAEAYQGHPYRMEITLPPLAAVFFRPEA